MSGQSPARVLYVFVGSWHQHPDAHAKVRTAALAFTDLPLSDHAGVLVTLDVGRSA